VGIIVQGGGSEWITTEPTDFMMKRIVSTLLLGLFASAGLLNAAGEGWHLNLEKALKVAKAEGKQVMIEFHGSDWCPPCKKLNEDVLSTAKFKAFAEGHLELVDADFPRRTELPAEQKAQNEALAERFGIRGFPTVVVLDAEGNELGRTVGFPRGGLEGFMKFLSKHVETGNPG
jgi:protein disulfide-isomerase